MENKISYIKNKTVKWKNM